MGDNLFPNQDFEEGWWHPGGVPELQIPLGWDIDFYEGSNDIDPDPYVRPEVRTLPKSQLPAHEQELFVRSGNYTGKFFKGYAPIMFTLFTREAILLPAGSGRITVPVYPDVIAGYEDNGAKIWADDPLSCMLRMFHGSNENDWMNVEFGEWNLLVYEWEQGQPTEDIFGVSARLPHPVVNNGLWIDDMEFHFESVAGEVYTGYVKVPAGYDQYEVRVLVNGIGGN